MQTTRQNVEKILFDLERDDISIKQTLSTDDIMEILLERSSAYSGTENDVLEQTQNILNDINNRAVWRHGIDAPLPIAPGIFGRLKGIVKQIIRRIIRPILAPCLEGQAQYNHVSLKLFNQVIDRMEQQDAIIHSIREMINKNHEREDDLYTILDYTSFEEHFRGAEDDIKNRQKEYIPYISGMKRVIDLGCGRGEFLELMREQGVMATGVDTCQDFVRLCWEKGLDVLQMDAMDYLEMLEPESVNGIVAFQLIEWLSPKQLVRLCQKAYEKLSKGGKLILETSNPTCLSIYANSFYIDCTHQKPVHPQMLQYVLTKAGFVKVELLYTESSKGKFRLPLIDESNPKAAGHNDAVNALNNLIWGSQDYAAIAIK